MGHGQFGSALLIPMWAFGIGLLASGIQMMVAFAGPMMRLDVGYQDIQERLKSIGHPSASEFRKPLTTQSQRSAVARIIGVAGRISLTSQICFALGLISGLVELSFR
jgi:hypothetical protein